jgi:4,5:9,10-diseco-3-hydroxy-5,9,17-trioxoandrosta-1(10),2-diene-4-oate hydrolase
MSEALPIGAFADIGDGLRMHYHAVGSGSPVLFLHGSGPGASGWSNFRENAAFLAEHGYGCILADSLGYGHSSKPTDRPYTLDFMAGGALALMDSLGHREFTLVGNSQGGAQAIHIAANHPGRVTKLVLMAPGGLETRERYMEMPGIRSMMRCIYGPEGITLFGMQKIFTKQVVDPEQVPDGVIERRFEIAQSQPRHVFESMRVDNQEENLSKVRCPTLGLWGKDDLFCPISGAAKLAQKIPNCRVIELEHCGHWVMVEQAQTFNDSLLEFLEND